jgi:hypothetical protein
MALDFYVESLRWGGVLMMRAMIKNWMQRALRILDFRILDILFDVE